MQDLNLVLLIILYSLGIILMTLLIVLIVKSIITISKVEKVIDDVNNKLSSVNNIFKFIDVTTDKIAYLGETVVGKASNLILNIIDRGNKNKEEEE